MEVNYELIYQETWDANWSRQPVAEEYRASQISYPRLGS